MTREQPPSKCDLCKSVLKKGRVYVLEAPRYTYDLWMCGKCAYDARKKVESSRSAIKESK